MDIPLISHKSQLGYKQEAKKAQRTMHMYMMCKPTHTYLIAQDKQVGSTTYTNTCKEQNQNMQVGK